MNGLDYILLGLAAVGMIGGFYRGFIAQIVSFAGFFIAYFVAFKFYDRLSPVLQSSLSLPSFETYQKYEFIVKGLRLETYIMNALSFAILFFGVKLALAIVGRMLNLIAKVPGLNVVNRASGALLGLLEAALIILIAVNVMTILPSDSAQKLMSGSTLAPYLINDFPSLAGKLQELWKQGVRI
jgi:uncharacterized membrane protein required for colicin V production